MELTHLYKLEGLQIFHLIKILVQQLNANLLQKSNLINYASLDVFLFGLFFWNFVKIVRRFQKSFLSGFEYTSLQHLLRIRKIMHE